MPDLSDGASIDMQGSGSKPYLLKNTGGVYSCSCPAWRNQSIPIEKRTCKHLRKLRGDAAESARVGSEGAAPARRVQKPLAAGGAGTEVAAGDTVPDKAPPVLLAQTWADLDPQPDPTGWWMSEKLDGVRAWWDGTQFLSRLGNRYHAPAWFTEGLPAHPLDGELWLARKQFQRCVATVRRQDAGEGWRAIRFLIFDAPAVDAPFEDRLAAIEACIASRKPAFAAAHAHQPCRGHDHLREELARIEAQGGEGLMLRQPGSRYVAGRSATLCKVKSFRDAEARVVGHLPGTGRHKGRLGALEVEMPDGTRFAVGTGFSDAERNAPPPIGTIITYRYQELSNDGVPRFPTWVGIREDAVWESTQRRAT